MCIRDSIQIAVSDPVSIENKLDYLKKNVGVSLNFPGIKFFLDYTIHDYNSINAGISIGLRLLQFKKFCILANRFAF